MPDPRRPGTTREQLRSGEHRDFSTEISSPPPPPPQVHRPTQESIIDRHGRFWDSVRKIAVGVVAVGGIMIAAFSWAVNAAIESKMAALRQSLDPLVVRPTKDELERMRLENQSRPPTLEERFNEQRAQFAEIKKAIDAPNSPQSELGKKLDALDSTLKERLPRRPDKVPVPPVGPTAKQQGVQ